MGTSEKFSAKADQAKGKVKETTGKATDDERMEAEGRAEKMKGDVKESVESAKDRVKDVFN